MQLPSDLGWHSAGECVCSDIPSPEDAGSTPAFVRPGTARSPRFCPRSRSHSSAGKVCVNGTSHRPHPTGRSLPAFGAVRPCQARCSDKERHLRGRLPAAPSVGRPSLVCALQCRCVYTLAPSHARKSVPCLQCLRSNLSTAAARAARRGRAFFTCDGEDPARARARVPARSPRAVFLRTASLTLTRPCTRRYVQHLCVRTQHCTLRECRARKTRPYPVQASPRDAGVIVLPSLKGISAVHCTDLLDTVHGIAVFNATVDAGQLTRSYTLSPTRDQPYPTTDPAATDQSTPQKWRRSLKSSSWAQASPVWQPRTHSLRKALMCSCSKRSVERVYTGARRCQESETAAAAAGRPGHFRCC